VVGADYGSGTLYFFDQNLSRLPDSDRDILIAPGLSVPTGIAWDDEAEGYFILQSGSSPSQVSSLARTLGAATALVIGEEDYSWSALTFLPDEGLMALLERERRWPHLTSLALFNRTGTLVEELDLSSIGQRGRGLEYLEGTQEFAVQFEGAELDVLRRQGAPSRVIDLSAQVATATAFADFEDGSGAGRLLVIGNTVDPPNVVMIVTDLEGNLLRRLDPTRLRLKSVRDIVAIRNGPRQGAFAAVDDQNSEVVVFSIDEIVNVRIDIKPGSDPNCFNVNGHGVIPVAILGSEDLNVTEVKTDATLSFNGLGVRVRGQKGPLCSVEESNGDQFLDLVCHFEDDPGQWLPGVGSTASLEGELVDGTRIKGSNSICIVP
jgi:hypothetical protein